MVSLAQMLDVHYDLHLGSRTEMVCGNILCPMLEGDIYLYALLMLQEPEEPEHYQKSSTVCSRDNEAILPQDELKDLYTCCSTIAPAHQLLSGPLVPEPFLDSTSTCSTKKFILLNNE